MGRLSNDSALYHIIPVSETTPFAQERYNAQLENHEFWERFENTELCTPVAYSSLINDRAAFEAIVGIFRTMDARGLMFAQMNRASDFVKSHLVTDGYRSITLCNKHLMRPSSRRTSSRSQTKYSSDAWIKSLLQALFPKAASVATASKNIPTNTPQYAVQLLRAKRDANAAGNGARPAR